MPEITSRFGSEKSPICTTLPLGGGPDFDRTTAVGAVVAVAVPALFFAVTSVRTVFPTSALDSLYFWPHAPMMFEQLLPPVSQRCQRNEKLSGDAPLQFPGLT